MLHSKFFSKKSFLLYVLIVSLLHLGFLALKISKDFARTAKEETTLNVRLKKDDDLFKDKKQIVQSEDPDVKTHPKESRFLSDKDRSFDRETKAKKIAPFEKAAKGDANVTFEGSKQKDSKKKPTPNMDLSDLGAFEKNYNPHQKAAKDYTKSRKGVRSGDPDSSGVSATNDYVEDVPVSDLTHLNTTEYKYYGFYFRIRQKLEQFWGRSIQEKAELIVKEGRRLPASQDHITALQITMDERGSIVSIRILGPSGIKELDDAAIESFNQAGPFPNPPKDLIVDGKVVIEWGFVVKT